MKNLFTYVASKAKRRKTFESSEEFHFFIEHRHILMHFPQFIHFYDAENDPFQMMRANIILQAFINKMKMEEEATNLDKYLDSSKKNHDNFDISFHEIIYELPYYEEENDKIYIPFFPRSLNQIYLNEPEKLLTSAYSNLQEDFKDTLIDPFDTYGSELYNSHFSRLVKIKTVDKETAFFHYDTNTIYFVNEQGRLDAGIVLFDRYIRHPSYSHMLERIKPVVDAYFAFDRNGLIDALYMNGFISNRLLRRIRFRDWAKV
ncbi:MAG: hypothetical protein J6X50_04460 [Bacilli bacterium]|nr:hypothetical protein [Bacilli bacterium]